MLQTEAHLMTVIYNCKKFIIQATGGNNGPKYSMQKLFSKKIT